MSVLITNGDNVVLVHGHVYHKILESQAKKESFEFHGFLTERNEDGTLATIVCKTGDWKLCNY